MVETQEQENVPLKCYHNGHGKVLPLKEAHALFWDVHYGWLLKLDWYRFEVDGYAGACYLYTKVEDCGRLFARYLHTRGTLCLTFGDWAYIQAKPDPLSLNAFQATARRFIKTFDGLPKATRPFRYVKAHGAKGLMEPAYRMRPDREWLVVVGVAPKSEVPDEDVDWSVFLVDPRKKKPKQKR